MDNPDTFYFENDWKPVYNPVQYENYDNNLSDDTEEIKDKKAPKIKKVEGKPLLMIIQILLCLIIMLAAYALQTFRPDMFKDIKGWYDKNLNNEIIMSETFENFSLDKLINEFKDK